MRRAALLIALAIPLSLPAQQGELWNRVEIRRTAHGVPHITADDYRAIG